MSGLHGQMFASPVTFDHIEIDLRFYAVYTRIFQLQNAPFFLEIQCFCRKLSPIRSASYLTIIRLKTNIFQQQILKISICH